MSHINHCSGWNSRLTIRKSKKILFSSSVVFIIVLQAIGTYPLFSQPSPPFPEELNMLMEIYDLVSTHGNTLWPGWGEPVPPVLLRDRDDDWLLWHPSPPHDFEILSEKFGGEFPLAVTHSHLTPAPLATTWPVAHIWTASLPIRSEFQRVVDDAFGPDVIQFDPPTYCRIVFHELFHAYQFTTSGGRGGLPMFVIEPDEREGRAEQKSLSNWRGDLIAEGQLLREGIRARTGEDARRAVRAFLTARARRRSLYSENLCQFENGVEWLEGTARYIDIRMTMLAGEQMASGQYRVAYPLPETTFQEFLRGLANLSLITTGERDWYAALGAGQAMLLDRMSPDWKRHFFFVPTSLDTLLHEAIVQ